MLSALRRLGAHRLATPSSALVVALGLLGGIVAASAMDGAPAPAIAATRTAAPSARPSASTVATRPTRSPPPFPKLPPLRVCSLNTTECAVLALYDTTGHVDPAAAQRLDELLADHRDPKRPTIMRLERRTLQLVYRAAYHFQSELVEVVSAYRRPGRRRREGPHALGAAIDFKLPGIAAATLAAYLRTLPRVGVGVYTHPRTQYVHLDVREQSFHWLDASPPNRTWRERPLRTKNLDALDASYTLQSDWPEGTSPPP